MSTIKVFLFSLMVSAGLIACGGDAGQDQATDTPAQTEAADHDHDHEHGDEAHEMKANEAGTSGFVAQHGEGKEYNSAYICPMHCKDSGSNEPGKCPACGMDYVYLKEHLRDGHSHNE